MFFVANFFKYLFQCIEISSLNYDMNCDIRFRCVHLTCLNRKNWHPILVEYVHPWILFHSTEHTLAHLTKIKKNFQSWITIFFKTFRILNNITIVKTYEFKAYGTCTFICFASKQAISYVMWIFMSEVDCFSRKCFIIYIGYPSLKKNANLVLMIYCNYFIHLLHITINNYDFSYSILIHVCND